MQMPRLIAFPVFSVGAYESLGETLKALPVRLKATDNLLPFEVLFLESVYLKRGYGIW